MTNKDLLWRGMEMKNTTESAAARQRTERVGVPESDQVGLNPT